MKKFWESGEKSPVLDRSRRRGKKKKIGIIIISVSISYGWRMIVGSSYASESAAVSYFSVTRWDPQKGSMRRWLPVKGMEPVINHQGIITHRAGK